MNQDGSGQKLTAYEIVPANDGGFVVYGRAEGIRDMNTGAFVRSISFAGSLDDCLAYMNRKLAPEDMPLGDPPVVGVAPNRKLDISRPERIRGFETAGRED